MKERTAAVHVWAAAALLLGCVDREASRAPLPTSGSATTDPQSSAASSSKPPLVGPPALRWGSELLRFADSSPECAALATSTRSQLALVRDPFESSSPDESAKRISAFRSLISEHTACVPSAGGSWATFFEGGADPRAWAWFVGFLPKNAALAKHAGNFPEQLDERSAPAGYSGKVDLFDGATYRGPYRLQVVSDYDGDGTAEAVIWTAQIGQELRSAARGVLWTFAQGAVAPYGNASKLVIAPFEVDLNAATEPAPLTDLDGDGRIDLLGYGPFFAVFKQGCGVIESFDALGPRLALHALADGSFSARDSAVLTHARQQCPQRPTRVLALGEKGLDRRATLLNLACARLWQVPVRAIDAERQAACGGKQPAHSDCDAPRKCSAEVLAVVAAWSKQPPPFTLE